jgi:hypothetical protein
MRLLLALFGFLALALAPFATPAMAASNPCSAEMVSHPDGHRQMPTDHDMKAHADLCCVGLATALPEASANMVVPIASKPLVAVSAITRLSGVQPAAADPPPRV